MLNSTYYAIKIISVIYQLPFLNSPFVCNFCIKMCFRFSHKVYAGGTMYKHEDRPVDSGAGRFKVEGVNKSVKMVEDGKGGVMPVLQLESWLHCLMFLLTFIFILYK